MAEETDGVGETFDESLRVALTVASQFGERMARLREQLARQREARATQEAQELSARYEAERHAARVSLAPVKEAGWWDQASPQDIANVHETATEWRDRDDAATEAGDTIKREVYDRYGIDVSAPGASASAVADALAQAERDRADAAAERTKAAEDLAASQVLFNQADRRERDQNAEAEKATGRPSDVSENGRPSEASQRYDSAERREQFASRLEARGIDKETISARILADSENAVHPSEAVLSTASKVVRSRTTPNGSVRQRTKGELSR